METKAKHGDADPVGYSPLKVMKSAAGYYVGRSFTDEEGMTVPGSRESRYYPTEQLAGEALLIFERQEEEQDLAEKEAAHPAPSPGMR